MIDIVYCTGFIVNTQDSCEHSVFMIYWLQNVYI